MRHRKNPKIKALVQDVASFTAAHFDLVDPDDVTDTHINFAYEILWSHDKLEVELNTDDNSVRRAICEVIEKWNTEYSAGKTNLSSPYGLTNSL